MITFKQKAMRNKIVVTINDYQRLMSLLEFAALNAKMADVTTRLVKTLSDARIIPQEKIERKIVTMNSRIKVKGIANGIENEITITYPRDAQPSERKVSVLSDIGVALLGKREQDLVSWKVPDGAGVFEVVKVIYQPEAAGDYTL